jgi:hypothetical protein
MARLDAVLGPSVEIRNPLWLDEDPAALSLTPTEPDKGPNKGPQAGRRRIKRPDPNSDRADEGGIGTACRTPGEPSHASQPSSESPTKRRMRHKEQDP